MSKSKPPAIPREIRTEAPTEFRQPPPGSKNPYWRFFKRGVDKFKGFGSYYEVFCKSCLENGNYKSNRGEINEMFRHLRKCTFFAGVIPKLPSKKAQLKGTDRRLGYCLFRTNFVKDFRTKHPETSRFTIYQLASQAYERVSEEEKERLNKEQHQLLLEKAKAQHRKWGFDGSGDESEPEVDSDGIPQETELDELLEDTSGFVTVTRGCANPYWPYFIRSAKYFDLKRKDRQAFCKACVAGGCREAIRGDKRCMRTHLQKCANVDQKLKDNLFGEEMRQKAKRKTQAGVRPGKAYTTPGRPFETKTYGLAYFRKEFYPPYKLEHPNATIPELRQAAASAYAMFDPQTKLEYHDKYMEWKTKEKQRKALWFAKMLECSTRTPRRKKQKRRKSKKERAEEEFDEIYDSESGEKASCSSETTEMADTSETILPESCIPDPPSFGLPGNVEEDYIPVEPERIFWSDICSASTSSFQPFEHEESPEIPYLPPKHTSIANDIHSSGDLSEPSESQTANAEPLRQKRKYVFKKDKVKKVIQKKPRPKPPPAPSGLPSSDDIIQLSEIFGDDCEAVTEKRKYVKKNITPEVEKGPRKKPGPQKKFHRFCSVSGCTSRFGVGARFFLINKSHPTVRRIWRNFCGQPAYWSMDEEDGICHRHFRAKTLRLFNEERDPGEYFPREAYPTHLKIPGQKDKAEYLTVKERNKLKKKMKEVWKDREVRKHYRRLDLRCCSVRGCLNLDTGLSDVIVYEIQLADKSVRGKWLEFCDLPEYWRFEDRDGICSAHFTEEENPKMVEMMDTGKRVFHGIVPSLNRFSETFFHVKVAVERWC